MQVASNLKAAWWAAHGVIAHYHCQAPSPLATSVRVGSEKGRRPDTVGSGHEHCVGLRHVTACSASAADAEMTSRPTMGCGCQSVCFSVTLQDAMEEEDSFTVSVVQTPRRQDAGTQIPLLVTGDDVVMAQDILYMTKGETS